MTLTYTDYLTALAAPDKRPFNAWRVAVSATLVGLAVTTALGFVLVLVAFFLGAAFVSAALRDGWSPQLPVIGTAFVVLSVVILSIPACIGLACQVWFIKRRGGARPLVATLTSVAAAWTVAMLGALIELTSVPLVMAGALTHVAVLAKTIEPESSAAP